MIIQDGIRRMYGEGESVFYYLTVMNEAYEMAAMPDGAGVREGIVKGLYRCRTAPEGKGKLRAQLLGSGAILPEVLKAQKMLNEKYGVRADVWSATSYGELYRDGHACRALEPAAPGRAPQVPYVTQCFEGTEGADHRRVGLPEGAARPDRSLAAAPTGLARNGWLRPQ